MRANAAQKATIHGGRTKIGAAPEAAAAAELVGGVEDVRIFGRCKFAGSVDLVVL